MNRCIDEHRKDTRHPWVLFSDLGQGDEDEYIPMVDTLLDTTPLPEEIAEHQDESDRLWTVIQSLPLKFRNVVELRLTFREIGHLLSIPPTTAQTYFYRACKKIRYELASQVKEILA